MIIIKDKNNPSFIRFPFHTNRTSWKPFGLPMVLVVPHIRDNDGNIVADSDIVSIRIYIAEVGSSRVPVAGHDHVGVFFPDTEIYSVAMDVADLINRKLSATQFVDADGVVLDGTDDGDYVKFTLRSGVIGDTEFIKHANYYDISDISIETEKLNIGKYTMVYEVEYHKRVVSSTDVLVCMQTPATVFSRHKFYFNHPGEVLLAMVEGTPLVNFDGQSLSDDKTIEFYRFMSEALQDIYDEQTLLKKVNWVYEISPQYIPYLGALIGWDIPYFPKSVDAVRRAFLRNIVRLQKLKGSKRAIRELFDLFGFAISISNLYWTPDGKSVLSPGESYVDETGVQYTISSEDINTTEPLINELTTPGFCELSIPLINRPINDSIILDVFLTEDSTDAETTVASYISDLDSIGALDSQYDDGVGVVSPFNVSDDGLISKSRITIDIDGDVSVLTVGQEMFGGKTIRYDRNTNVLYFSVSKYQYFESSKLYAFATYAYSKLTVPDSMVELRSNRFDIEILSKNDDEVEPDVIVFLVDYLFKIKAFHSLLRKLIYTINIYDTYLVTDLCVGGNILQRPDVDAGKIQVPPEAIIPVVPDDICEWTDPLSFGYRAQDLAYRDIILEAINNEFEAWKIIADACGFNYKGQDRTTVAREQVAEYVDGELVHDDDDRETLCDDNNEDFCYKGRVTDNLGVKTVLPLCENFRFSQCAVDFGYGSYYMYRSPTFSGDIVHTYGNMLGTMMRNYTTSSFGLHYSDDKSFDSSDDYNRKLAFRKPSLNIKKDNLNYPGHRLPTLDKLFNDVTIDGYKMKPWDYDVVCGCGPYVQNPLNAYLDGSELIFDDVEYSIQGNGFVADIASFGNQPATSTVVAADVTHTIYLDISGGHESIELEGIVQSVGIINVSNGIFSSAIECGTDDFDHSAGYPAETGYLNASDYFGVTDEFGAITGSDEDELSVGLEIPSLTVPSQLLFTFNSQIKVSESDPYYHLYKPLRFDCGCSKVVCGSLGSEDFSVSLSCSIDDFIELYGNIDNDQVEMDLVPTLVETQHTDELLCNNIYSSFFNVLQSYDGSKFFVDVLGYEADDPFPDNGSFAFKDEYGIIYEYHWETILNYLDFIVVIKDPRVYGEEDSGYIVDGEVYRNGTITVDRIVYNIIDGEYIAIASGTEQTIGTFKSTFKCGVVFTNPFVNVFDHNMIAEFEHEVTVGSHWTDSDSTGETEWADVGSTGDVLTWIDVFA